MHTSGCVFCSIVAGKIPATFILQNDYLVVFKDRSPRAPVHFLIVPKKHLSAMHALSDADQELGWQLVRAARELAEKYGNPSDHGFNLMANNGASAGQEVPHLHWHFLAGKRFEI